MHEHGCAKLSSQTVGLRVFEVASYLWEIGSAARPGVEVDADTALRDDLCHEEVRQLGSGGTSLRAGKAAVEVPSIRQVTRVLDDAEYVDDGNGQDGPR